MKVNATATVTIRVECPSVWNESHSVDQIFQEAAAETTKAVQSALRNSRVTILKPPIISAVIAEGDEN